MKKILLIGATSAIARATAQRYAAQGARFYLLARDPQALADLADDLLVRGAAAVDYDTFDAEDLDSLPEVVADAIAVLGDFDLVLLAHARRSTPRANESADEALTRTIDVNTTSHLILLEHLARFCEAQRYGTLAVLSSVAADRGHRSTGVYAASKAALDVYLQGLRQRLHPAGVRVITLKPGLTDTPLTADLRKGALWRSPETVAAGIEKAVARGSNVAYLPGWWRAIALLWQHLPEALYKRVRG